MASGAKILITGMPNAGKCQSVETKIPTPDGWRRLGDIEVGDLVFSEDGKPTKVIGVFPQGVKDNYIITFNDGTSTNCGADHLWKCKRFSRTIKEWRVFDTKTLLDDNLMVGTRKHYKYHIPKTCPVEYTEKELPIHPYVLGVLIGDGSLTLENIAITSAHEDRDVQERCKQLTPEEEWTQTESSYENKFANRLSRNSSIRKAIVDMGLNVYSRDRFIPEIYMFGSVWQRRELLAGLMDTDGSCCTTKSAMFNTKSLQLAKDIQMLIESLGGMAKLVAQDRRDKGIEYKVGVRTDFNPFILKRKADVWDSGERRYNHRNIASIEYNGECEQICIMVNNPNHTYLTEHYIVTHNTTLLKKLTDTLVISRDGKPFPFAMPHVNVGEYENVNQLMDIVQDKMNAYKAKVGKYPATVAFDSVSRILTDIETHCNSRFSGFDVWKNINSEINFFVYNVSELVNAGFNVVLIAHVMWDEKAGKFIETSKGSFKNTGGFLSTVDYAINVDVQGSDYIVQHHGNNLSRTLIEGMPKKQPADEFSLQEYINTIKAKTEMVNSEWSL